MTAAKLGVLFVCHANICRSPLAHAAFRHLAEQRGVLERLDIDGAGTWADEGLLPHRQSIAVAAKHGISFEGVGGSRSIVPEDLERFEHIIAMDRANESDVRRLCRISAFGRVEEPQGQIRLFRRLAVPRAQGRDADVPDPVQGGPEQFEHVFDLIEAGCRALLDELAPKLEVEDVPFRGS